MRYGRMLHQKARGALNERKNVHLAKGISLPKSPCKDDREGNLVELNARPVRPAIHPKILRKPAVGLLGAGQVHQGAPRSFRTPTGKKSRCRLHHIASPYEVIATQVIVAVSLSPRDGRRCNKGARKGLVFVSQQNVVAGPHQFASVARLGREPLRVLYAMPLADEAFAMLFKWGCKRAHRLLQCRVIAFAEPNGQREFTRAINAGCAKIQLAKERNIAVARRAKLPVHGVLIHQVPPAVAGSDKPAADTREPATGRHGQRRLIFPGQQHLVSGHIEGTPRITRSSSVQMGSQQCVYLQPWNQVLVPLEANPLQDHAVVRVADDLLGERVAAVHVAIDVAYAEGFLMNVFECRQQMALLLVNEGLAIGDEELHIANLGAVDRRMIDLVQDAVGAGKPNPARGGVGSA